MKIIKHGKLKTKTAKTTCRSCASVLQEDESRLRWEHDPRGEAALARAKCPVCKSEIFFYR